MTHIFIWRLEDIFGLIVLTLILLVGIYVVVKSKIKQWKKKK